MKNRIQFPYPISFAAGEFIRWAVYAWMMAKSSVKNLKTMLKLDRNIQKRCSSTYMPFVTNTIKPGMEHEAMGNLRIVSTEK